MFSSKPPPKQLVPLTKNRARPGLRSQAKTNDPIIIEPTSSEHKSDLENKECNNLTGKSEKAELEPKQPSNPRLSLKRLSFKSDKSEIEPKQPSNPLLGKRLSFKSDKSEIEHKRHSTKTEPEKTESVTALLAPPTKPVARPSSGRRPPTKPLQIQIKTYDVPTCEMEKPTSSGEDISNDAQPKITRGVSILPMGARMPLIPQGGVNLRKVDRKESILGQRSEDHLPAFAAIKLRATNNSDRLRENNESLTNSSDVPLSVPLGPPVHSHDEATKSSYSGRPPPGPPPAIPSGRPLQASSQPPVSVGMKTLNLSSHHQADIQSPKAIPQTTREVVLDPLTSPKSPKIKEDPNERKENLPVRSRAISSGGDKKAVNNKKTLKKKGFSFLNKNKSKQPRNSEFDDIIVSAPQFIGKNITDELNNLPRTEDTRKERIGDVKPVQTTENNPTHSAEEIPTEIESPPLSGTASLRASSKSEKRELKAILSSKKL